jgi:hypothetical protein
MKVPTRSRAAYRLSLVTLSRTNPDIVRRLDYALRRFRCSPFFCMADQISPSDHDSWGIRIESALAVTRVKVIDPCLQSSAFFDGPSCLD